MNFIAWLCLTQALSMALALYHIPSREVFEPPKPLPNNSFFGYSITYYPKETKLVISAPAEEDIGEVYLCNLDKNQSCARIKHDIHQFSRNYTHKYWFGATVKAGSDFVITCAPRYTDLIPSFKETGTFARCYRYSDGILTKLPSINNNDRVRDAEGTVEFAMDSFGWSIDVASDNSVIVGGPGMFTGRSMIYQPGKLFPIFMRRSREFTSTLNFGYSVSSGKFINNDLSYAVSSTYGKIGAGEVFFFKQNKRQSMLPEQVDINIIGSMYGAVLCAAKLNGTNTDLLVGAPAYAGTHEYNVGAVHVYIFHTKGKPPKYKRTIKGQSDGSLFGSAIVALGDTNGDEKDEIAIGAPFDNNGQGAVYVYSGADLMGVKAPTWLQKIDPEPAYATSFGWSLTPLLDYNQNGCNELAIGSPYNDKVVLLKCLTAITVTTYMKFPYLQNRTKTGQTEFQLEGCLSVQYPTLPRNIIANIETTVTLSHPHAKLTQTSDPYSYTFNTSLHERKLEYCTPVSFTLPKTGNYEVGIYCRISSKLVDNPLNAADFKASRVYLSDRNVLDKYETYSAAECSGKQCQPKFIYEFTSSIPKEGYKIGSSFAEYFLIKLTNVGEVAYDACLRVNVMGVKVLKTSSPPCAIEENMTENQDSVLCKPTTVHNNSVWFSEKIYVEMTELTSLDHSVSVEVDLFYHCKEPERKLSYKYEYHLVGDPEGVAVKGVTNIGDLVNMTKTDIGIGKKFDHVYTIVNRGKTNWKEIKPVIALEKKPFIKYNKHPVLLFEGPKLTICEEMHVDSNDTLRFICEIDSLKDQEIRIVIPMDIVANTLDGILEEKNVTVSSNIKLSLDETHLATSINTIIQLKEAVVPLWVILLASLIGLFILSIIAFVLYKCNFLRRKKKEELQKLQRSVKRQTIRRSTMRKQDPPEECRQMLEQVTEENAEIEKT